MAALQPLCYLIGISAEDLTKKEKLILEAELFVQICLELKNHHRMQFKNYFRLIKLTLEMEDSMLENNFAQLIIKDILLTEQYTLEGIARYTDTPEDFIYEVITSSHTSPSLSILRKLIELHKSVRPDIYEEILKKITSPKPLIN